MTKALICTLSTLCILGLAGCTTSGGSVAEKVMVDFGLKAKPEGYVSGTDKIYASLPNVAKQEMKRMNTEQRRGSIKFQEDGVRGMYYKETKIYDNYYPLDARAIPQKPSEDRGYNGYIEYSYRIYESERRPTRVEAEALTATIAGNESGRERYRYTFGPGGIWDGGKGEQVKR